MAQKVWKEGEPTVQIQDGWVQYNSGAATYLSDIHPIGTKGILAMVVIQIGLMEARTAKGFHGGVADVDYCPWRPKEMSQIYSAFLDKLTDASPYAIWGAIGSLVGREMASKLCKENKVHCPLGLPGTMPWQSASNTSIRTISERDTSDSDEGGGQSKR